VLLQFVVIIATTKTVVKNKQRYESREMLDNFEDISFALRKNLVACYTLYIITSIMIMLTRGFSFSIVEHA